MFWINVLDCTSFNTDLNLAFLFSYRWHWNFSIFGGSRHDFHINSSFYWFFCPKFFLFLLFIYFWEREREAEREGNTESESGFWLWAVSGWANAGLELPNHEIMTWAKIRCLTVWATQAPRVPSFVTYSPNFYSFSWQWSCIIPKEQKAVLHPYPLNYKPCFWIHFITT